MSSDSTDTTGEPTNDWHPLPAMVGQAITEFDGPRHCGGYLVRQTDQDDIEIHRVIEMAESRAALESDGIVTEIHEYAVVSEACGHLTAPEDGWETETDAVPDSFWEGYK